MPFSNLEDISLSDIGKGWPYYQGVKLPYIGGDDAEAGKETQPPQYEREAAAGSKPPRHETEVAVISKPPRNETEAVVSPKLMQIEIDEVHHVEAYNGKLARGGGKPFSAKPFAAGENSGRRHSPVNFVPLMVLLLMLSCRDSKTLRRS